MYGCKQFDGSLLSLLVKYKDHNGVDDHDDDNGDEVNNNIDKNKGNIHVTREETVMYQENKRFNELPYR